MTRKTAVHGEPLMKPSAANIIQLNLQVQRKYKDIYYQTGNDLKVDILKLYIKTTKKFISID